MSYLQVFRSELNLVYTRCQDSISLAGARRCAIETFRDPRYRPAMRELYDLRAATDADARLGFNSLHEIHESQATWIRNLRRGGMAVLVAGNDLVFGLCRIYASLVEMPDFSVSPCRDWRAACLLLGLDPQLDFAALRAEG